MNCRSRARVTFQLWTWMGALLLLMVAAMGLGCGRSLVVDDSADGATDGATDGTPSDGTPTDGPTIDAASVVAISVDPATATVPVGGEPYELCLNPQDSKVYCCNFTGNSVTVIDAVSNEVITTLAAEIGRAHV
jgi:YVTN family beta-propeller protein